jgi:hypothetical protein
VSTRPSLETTEGLDQDYQSRLTFSFGPASQAVMRVDAAERGVGVRWTNLACHVETGVGHPNQSAADLARREERAQRHAAADAG